MKSPLRKNKFRRYSFEYVYMILMVIYMSRMTNETSRMVFSLFGPVVPFMIPIVMTAILLYRNPIRFASRNLMLVLGATAVWQVAFMLANKPQLADLSYTFFLFYGLVIAYIHVRVYGRMLARYYEEAIALFAQISVVMWCLTTVLPGLVDSLFSSFPATIYGHNILYVFNVMTDPEQFQGSLRRNAGCAWEPGRFAIELLLGIMCNFSRRGVTLRSNRNLLWLIAALLLTFSTTGYFMLLVLVPMYFLTRFSVRRVVPFILLLVPLSYFVMTLDFMGAKIGDRMSFQENADKRQEILEWNAKVREEGEYVGSIDRIESIYFEWQNFLDRPYLGYSRNFEYSWFRQNLSSNYALTGGLVKQISMFGIFLGLFFYLCLFRSSTGFGRDSIRPNRYALFVIMLLSSVSYIVFLEPLFTAFWFYGLFKRDAQPLLQWQKRKVRRRISRQPQLPTPIPNH